MEEMRSYIGVKMVKAVPMRSEHARLVLGREIDIRNVCDADMIGGTDAEGYVVQYSDGYKSWCPKAQFELANRPADDMTFGFAIEAAKTGAFIARRGWNGVGIFVFIQSPELSGGENHYAPHLVIDTTKLQTENPDAPKCQVPWLASQADMLAEDWMIVG
jgi:hypothetical protein